MKSLIFRINNLGWLNKKCSNYRNSITTTSCSLWALKNEVTVCRRNFGLLLHSMKRDPFAIISRYLNWRRYFTCWTANTKLDYVCSVMPFPGLNCVALRRAWLAVWLTFTKKWPRPRWMVVNRLSLTEISNQRTFFSSRIWLLALLILDLLSFSTLDDLLEILTDK